MQNKIYRKQRKAAKVVKVSATVLTLDFDNLFAPQQKIFAVKFLVYPQLETPYIDY